MNEEKPKIKIRRRSAEESKELENEIASLREKYGKRKNWPEIEKILQEDVNAPLDDIVPASGFLKDQHGGQGEEDDEDVGGEEILSRLQKESPLKSSYYQSGMLKEDFDKYDSLIDELFTKKQIKNRAYFKAFLTCDDMQSIAKRAGCSKQYIQQLFDRKAIEFVNSPKFIAITKDIVVKYRVMLEVMKEILNPYGMTNGDAEWRAYEAAWDRFHKKQIPDFDKRAKKVEEEIDFELSGTLKDFTPGKLKEMIPCSM